MERSNEVKFFSWYLGMKNMPDSFVALCIAHLFLR